MSEVLIGRGKTAIVYKIKKSHYELIRKEFSPIYPVRLWNWFFYNSPHPLTTETGYKYAYWKRRLAHRLCKCSNCDIYVTDALQQLPKGFTSKYIEGHPPPKRQRRALYKIIRKLEDFFDFIGMPTWSFSRKNPFSISNFIIKQDTIYIIDYEQSVPVLDSRRRVGYDMIYFADVNNFISKEKLRILNRLGGEEAKYLDEALEMALEFCKQLDIRPKGITKFVNIGMKKYK